jgi:hypothetical protein
VLTGVVLVECVRVAALFVTGFRVSSGLTLLIATSFVICPIVRILTASAMGSATTEYRKVESQVLEKNLASVPPEGRTECRQLSEAVI